MWRRCATILCVALLVACSDDPDSNGNGATTPGNGDGGQPSEARENRGKKPVRKPGPDEAARKAQVEALAKRKTDLQAQVAELDKALKELEKKQKAEKPKPADIRKLRDAFTAMLRDANDAQGKYERLKKRHAELKKFADSEVTGKVRDLQKQRGEMDKQRAQIHDAWKKDLADDIAGRAFKESAAMRDLFLLRDVKRKWFEATPPVRRGVATVQERKLVSDGFRAWIGELEPRKAVVAKVLQQPHAPKGKTPDSYDFTKLDFYLLMEFMEDDLDRKSVALERKELSKSRGKLDKIQAEIDRLDEKIREQMLAAGGEFEEYEEIRERLPKAASMRDYLTARFEFLAQRVKELAAIDDRHAKEYEAEYDKLDAVERELQKVERQIRKLGGE